MYIQIGTDFVSTVVAIAFLFYVRKMGPDFVSEVGDDMLISPDFVRVTDCFLRGAKGRAAALLSSYLSQPRTSSFACAH